MTEKIWFTSDLHFGHQNILKFCPTTRQGRDVKEMERLIIEKWQAKVSPQDRVYVLGDVFFKRVDEAISIMDQLPGQIHLVYGNHDKIIKSNKSLRDRFTSVSDYKDIVIDGQKIVMFHFPIYEWDQMHRGSFHLFGHIHGKDHGIPGRLMDVGIDTRPGGDMEVWSWEEIKKNLEKKEIRTHH